MTAAVGGVFHRLSARRPRLEFDDCEQAAVAVVHSVAQGAVLGPWLPALWQTAGAGEAALLWAARAAPVQAWADARVAAQGRGSRDVAETAQVLRGPAALGEWA